MSSIMDRLRKVEVAASPPGFGGEQKQDGRTGNVKAPRQSHRGGVRSPAKTLTGSRVLACALAVLAVLAIWRAWKAEPPSYRAGRGKEARVRTAGIRPPREATAALSSSTSVERPSGNADEPRSRASASNISLSLPGIDGVSTSKTSAAGMDVPNSGAPSPPAVASQPPLEGKSSSPPGPASPQDAMAGLEGRDDSVLMPDEDQKTKSRLLSLKVTGLYKDAAGYVALIDGREFQRGDKIAEAEILEITSGKITFGFKGKRYNLPFRW